MNLSELLIHPSTVKEIESFVSSGSHALLLHAPVGYGKETVAVATAAKLLGLKTLDNAPYFTIIKPITKHVTIEQIRQVQTTLQLKTTGVHGTRRVIIITEADTMTDEAQNAFLKSLEEPPLDTVIILTASQLDSMKQTIRSRVQAVAIRRINATSAIDYFAAKHPAKDVSWAHTISDGGVGLMTALLENQSDHTVAAQIKIAKSLYGMSSFERLATIEPLLKDKDAIPELLYACKRICIGGLEAAAAKDQQKSLATWHKQLLLISEAEETLSRSPNLKLMLTNLFIHM